MALGWAQLGGGGIRTRYPHGSELMTLRDVAVRLGVSRRVLFDLRKSEGFPVPVDMGYARTVLWRKADIENWHRANRR